MSYGADLLSAQKARGVQVRRGARGKYCPAIVEEICGHISNGLGKLDSANLAGISSETLFCWMREKPDFSAAVKKAEVAHKSWHIRNIKQHADKNWAASAWTLERKYQDEFGLKQKLEHSGNLSVGLADLVSKSRKNRGVE